MNLLIKLVQKILAVLPVFVALSGLSQQRELSYEQPIRHQRLQYIAAGDSVLQLEQARTYYSEGDTQ